MQNFSTQVAPPTPGLLSSCIIPACNQTAGVTSTQLILAPALLAEDIPPPSIPANGLSLTVSS